MNLTTCGSSITVLLGLLIPCLTDNPSLVFFSSFLSLAAIVYVMTGTVAFVAELGGSSWTLLLDSVFGNSVDLILAIVAVLYHEVLLAQTLLLGAVLSNLLLLLGTSFLVAGIRGRKLQGSLEESRAQTFSSMLIVSAISVILSTFLHYSVPDEKFLLTIYSSRFTSLILLILYALYIKFVLDRDRIVADSRTAEEQREMTANDYAMLFAVLLIELISVFLISRNLIRSLRGFAKSIGLKESLIGLLILPLAANSAKHFACIKLAMNEDLKKVMYIAVGSSITVSNFLFPVLVLISWRIGWPSTLVFPPFQAFCLFLAVYMTHLILHDGQSNWLEGSILLFLYAIIAITFCYYPNTLA